MKTVKWIWVLIACILGLAVGVLGSIGVYYLTMENVAWETFLHDELVPMLTIGLSVIGAVFAALMPLLKNVSLGADKFSSAAKAIEKVSNDNEKNVRKISDLENRLENIERASKNTEEIVRIGFGNLKELVVKGHAREIAKVGKEEEISNEETN